MSRTKQPEVRKQLLAMTETAVTAFLTSMQPNIFSDPESDESLSIMVESVAASLAALTRNNPNQSAILRTLALNILDHTTSEETP